MENKIKDQKVFVLLRNVTELQKRYQRAKSLLNVVTSERSEMVTKARVQAFEEAIAVLQLPL